VIHRAAALWSALWQSVRPGPSWQLSWQLTGIWAAMPAAWAAGGSRDAQGAVRCVCRSACVCPTAVTLFTWSRGCTGRRPRQPSEDAFEDVGGGGGGNSGGAGAPSVGVLMELVAAVRCPDGRLIVLAYGLGRLRVGSNYAA
jgi:hypothetical protein